MRSKDFTNRYFINQKLSTENQYIGGDNGSGYERRGETRYQVNVEGADTLNSVQPQGKLKHQTAWQNIGSAITGNQPSASTAVDVKNFDLVRFKAVCVDPAGQTDQQQTLTPDAAPDAGTYKIKIGALTTAAIAAAATATQIRDAIRLLTGFANVTVTGTLATTAVVTFVGHLTSPGLIEIVDNTLTATAVPVVVTPTISTALVTGSDVNFIASSFWD